MNTSLVFNAFLERFLTTFCPGSGIHYDKLVFLKFM